MADTRTAVSDVQNALLYTDYFYVDTVKADKLAENAIRGMLKELDPHSTYLTKEEVQSMNEGLGDNFEGIGVRYQMENDTLFVISTVVGGPSEKQGVMAGDHIVAVNDSSIAGQKMSNKEIQRRLRGPKGTVVKITVLREGDLIDFNITRDILLSKSRKRQIVQARQIAMFECRNLIPNCSLSTIGSELGGKDHATVLHACTTVQDLMSTDKTFRQYVTDIENMVAVPVER